MKKTLSQHNKTIRTQNKKPQKDSSIIYEGNDLREIKRAYKEIPPKENTDFKKLINSAF